MFYKLIEKKRNEWLNSNKCTVSELLKYIEKRGFMRDAQLEAIKKKVDAKAERLTRKELNMPKDEWWFGSCHTSWKHKKKILRAEYHMIWRSPQDLNPETCFD